MKASKIISGAILCLAFVAISVRTQELILTTANSSIAGTPQTPSPPTGRAVPLVFDLNDFAKKGLPPSAALPMEDLDQAAVTMAQLISRSDDHALPVLLTALQTAGFTVIDEKRNVLQKPLGDGKGQGLAIFDFEAVGVLKLSSRGMNTSLDKITSLITKDTPQISASRLSELILQNLRIQADNKENAYMRFWARLIIELGKTSPLLTDLTTATTTNVNLSVLQATLLTRRLQGDLFVLKAKLNQVGNNQSPVTSRNLFSSAIWRKENFSIFHPARFIQPDDLPCNLTGDEALILDAASVGLTTWNGWQVGMLGESVNAAGKATTLGKLGLGLQGVNIGLAWVKLVAAVTSLKGELTVDNPPVIRTLNSTPGDKRLMKARIWSEVGKKEMLNCLRPILNAATGLDFNFPSDGPVSDVAVEWRFAGDNETRVNNADTRNFQKFVFFQPPAGKDRDPQKQVTDGNGISEMYLVGSPKIPAVVYQTNPMKVEKKANVLVGVTLKSAKDFTQNWVDIGGIAVGTATGGPLGLLGSAAEIGYRVPYVAARATIPVIDHEPCDGQWQGTITYTVINTIKTRTEIPASPNNGFQVTAGGHESLDSSVTLSGTISVNGIESMADSLADEVTTGDHFTSGKVLCSPKQGWRPFTVRQTQTMYASGSAQGKVTPSITLDPDTYRISLRPLTFKTTLQSNRQGSSSGRCAGDKPTSESISMQNSYGSNDPVVGKSSYGPDRNVLSGSDSKTLSTANGSIVTTITWNLRRCIR